MVGPSGNLDMIAMQNLGDGSNVAREVSLRPLGDTAAAPGNENMLGQPRVGILNLDEGKLDATFAEVFD